MKGGGAQKQLGWGGEASCNVGRCAIRDGRSAGGGVQGQKEVNYTSLTEGRNGAVSEGGCDREDLCQAKMKVHEFQVLISFQCFSTI